MAISKIGGTGSDNWELISSVTPTASAASVNFTGLSVYRKFMILAKNVSSTGILSVRINNDSTTAAYVTSWQNAASGVASFGFDINTLIDLTTGSGTSSFYVQIESCDTTNLKVVTNGAASAGSTVRNQFYSIYTASAVVSQLNVISTGTFTATGTIAIYGVK
jgi:hypothetical protein